MADSSVKLSHNPSIDNHVDSLLESDDEPVVDEKLSILEKLAPRIHVTYLFDPKWSAVLERLRFYISVDKSGDVDSKGWDLFAEHLNVPTHHIHNIQNYWNGKEGREAVFWLLYGYSTLEHATLDKVIDALRHMGRYDVISEIEPHILECLKFVSKESYDDDSNIFKYNNMPPIPNLLSIASKVNNSTPSIKQMPQNTRNLLLKVMLTYADDEKRLAIDIQKVLVSRNIGVLALSNEKRKVATEGARFVHRYFTKVDFVIPILSKRYFKIIENIEKANKITSSEDERYANFIYDSLRMEYTKNQCQYNRRVRCIIPDEYAETIINSNIHPVLGIWFKRSNLHDLIDLMVLSRSINQQQADLAKVQS